MIVIVYVPTFGLSNAAVPDTDTSSFDNTPTKDGVNVLSPYTFDTLWSVTIFLQITYIAIAMLSTLIIYDPAYIG